MRLCYFERTALIEEGCGYALFAGSNSRPPTHIKSPLRTARVPSEDQMLGLSSNWTMSAELKSSARWLVSHAVAGVGAMKKERRSAELCRWRKNNVRAYAREPTSVWSKEGHREKTINNFVERRLTSRKHSDTKKAPQKRKLRSDTSNLDEVSKVRKTAK